MELLLHNDSIQLQSSGLIILLCQTINDYILFHLNGNSVTMLSPHLNKQTFGMAQWISSLSLY